MWQRTGCVCFYTIYMCVFLARPQNNKRPFHSIFWYLQCFRLSCVFKNLTPKKRHFTIQKNKNKSKSKHMQKNIHTPNDKKQQSNKPKKKQTHYLFKDFEETVWFWKPKTRTLCVLFLVLFFVVLFFVTINTFEKTSIFGFWLSIQKIQNIRLNQKVSSKLCFLVLFAFAKPDLKSFFLSALFCPCLARAMPLIPRACAAAKPKGH